MSPTIKYSAVIIFAINTGVWIYGLSKHRFLFNEIWLYLAIFLVPGLVILGSMWLMGKPPTWRRVLGFLIFLAGMVVWLVSLLLVYGGFKIH